MREVRACDFCGEGATGVYEPVPESVGEGPRVLLCDGCRDQLAAVVDPLLDHLDADTGGGLAGTAAADAGAASGDAGADPEPAADAGATAAGEPDTGSPSGGDDAASGDGDAEQAPDGTASAGAGGSGAGSIPGIGADGASGTPAGYRQVMRFLENRELPMPREEAEQLAADAYGLDRATVEAAVDHAVKYDRLRDVGGELKR